MSADPEQDYFSDGMMEEILNQLVKIRELKVISRTSSMTYKGSKLSLKSIAEKLGVSNVVEGSVRKNGNNIRISVQLVDARNDKHLWTATFDRDLSNVFFIQTEISKNIAQELKAILSREEQKQLQQIPTSNHLAHDYYLKGLYYHKEYDWTKGIEMCTKAIELDPEFTLAYVLRSTLNALKFFNKEARWENYYKLSKSDLLKAIELDPNLTEVKICQAFNVYYTERKYEEAILILKEVQQDRPNDSQIYFDLAIIQRRTGLWREALLNLEKAESMDPGNHDYLFQLARLHSVLRNYRTAIQYFDKVLSIDPEFKQVPFLKYYTLMAWKGDPEIADNLTTSQSDEAEIENEKLYYKREFAKLIEVLLKSEDEIQEAGDFYKPRQLALEELYYREGNKQLCKSYGDSAIALIKSKVNQSFQDFRLYAALAYANAYIGNHREAITNAVKANEMMPLTLDPYWDGVQTEQNLVDIYIISGKYDLAMDKIEYLLTIPGIISVPLLKINPKYDNLRNLPRFQNMLAATYVTKY